MNSLTAMCESYSKLIYIAKIQELYLITNFLILVNFLDKII